jgi:hypothetical protein
MDVTLADVHPHESSEWGKLLFYICLCSYAQTSTRCYFAPCYGHSTGDAPIAQCASLRFTVIEEVIQLGFVLRPNFKEMDFFIIVLMYVYTVVNFTFFKKKKTIIIKV